MRKELSLSFMSPLFDNYCILYVTPMDYAICLSQASQDKKSLDVGANLFIGNLDPVSS